MSQMDQKRRPDRSQSSSGYRQRTDVVKTRPHVPAVPEANIRYSYSALSSLNVGA
jgi:hypothetical protein